MINKELLVKFEVLSDEELLLAFEETNKKLSHMIMSDVNAILENRDTLEFVLKTRGVIKDGEVK
jgi:hypothetical protein